MTWWYFIIHPFTSSNYSKKDELYRKYALVFSICPVTKAVHDEGTYPLESSYEQELEKVLGTKDPASNLLPIKAAKAVHYPGTNFIKTSVNI